MISYTEKINQFLKELDRESLQKLMEISTLKTYKKGEVFLKQGEICKKSYLLEKGIARKYYLNDGKEITT